MKGKLILAVNAQRLDQIESDALCLYFVSQLDTPLALYPRYSIIHPRTYFPFREG